MRSSTLNLILRSRAYTPVTHPTLRSFISTPSMSASPAPLPPSSPPRQPVRIPGPVETSIQTKLVETFKPTLIRISNDSSKHAHHSAMRAQGGGNGETHFAVSLVSPLFTGKTQIARHRLVNALLKDEFENQGLHALSLRLKTPEEWEGEVEGVLKGGR